jgi:hypothetical protein
MSDGGAEPATPSAVGLALSGGGSRAIAFHLGCLRALHDLGILPQVKVLSTVSGGSIIGGLYAATDAPFPEFERRVRETLARGLVLPAVRTAFLTAEGPKALLCAGLTGSINIVFHTYHGCSGPSGWRRRRRPLLAAALSRMRTTSGRSKRTKGVSAIGRK